MDSIGRTWRSTRPLPATRSEVSSGEKKHAHWSSRPTITSTSNAWSPARGSSSSTCPARRRLGRRDRACFPRAFECPSLKKGPMPEHFEDVDGMLDVLVRWLVFEASPTASTEELLHGFAQQLGKAGFDLIRLNLQMRPLSPQAAAVLYVWRPDVPSSLAESDLRAPTLLSNVVGEDKHSFDGGRVQVTALAHGVLDTEPFRVSPIFPITIGGDAEVRRRIAADQTDFDFPILRDLHAQGATDYIAFPMRFYESAPSAISFATKKSGGFSDTEIAVLREARRPLLLALSPRLSARTLRTLLGAYLGSKTADRVLSGKIERGDVQEIEAAIWFSDLRGFTPMSATTVSSDLIAWLNDYFAAVGRAIVEHDGEILKFIGDAILAVWPVAEFPSREDTCRTALAAAKAANRELDALNAERTKADLMPMQHGIGLHVGRAQYGNIGAEGRLDFTVIGQAVNTASRLEGMCAQLSRRVVASADFAGLCGENLVSLGATLLKGVEGTREVFGIDERYVRRPRSLGPLRAHRAARVAEQRRSRSRRSESHALAPPVGARTLARMRPSSPKHARAKPHEIGR